MSELHNALAELLREAGRAHHQAFIETGGEDPDWPHWYASYLKPKLEKLLSQTFTESEILFWLVGAEREHSESASTPWPEAYASYILDQLHLE